MRCRGILLDENIEARLTQYLRTRSAAAGVPVAAVGQPPAPALGTKDPEILIWCEENDFVLVTDNRHSMPPHLADHLRMGRHVPGIVVVKKHVSLVALGEHLLYAIGSSPSGVLDDRIVFATPPK